MVRRRDERDLGRSRPRPQPKGPAAASRPAGRGALFAAACVALAVVAAGATGCKKKRIPVVKDHKDKSGDYGHIALDAAVASFRKTPADPTAYRTLAVAIDKLRPRFNAPVAEKADRDLAFLALEPMAAHIDEPFPAQAQALALTVWPTALRVEPTPGETVEAYLRRVCKGDLASDCKYVVPASWPLVLSGVVWARMKTRAREAYSQCQRCGEDPTYKAVLERYDQMQTVVAEAVRKAGDRVEHSAWPEAGPRAAPWSGAPLLDLVAAPPTLAGTPIVGDWHQRLRARPDGATILGLHVRPGDSKQLVLDVLHTAARAGWRGIALQVRERAFPFPTREYRLTEGGGRGPTATVRSVDTVQVLVRALDDALAHAGTEPGPPAAPPVHLRAR